MEHASNSAYLVRWVVNPESENLHDAMVNLWPSRAAAAEWIRSPQGVSYAREHEQPDGLYLIERWRFGADGDLRWTAFAEKVEADLAVEAGGWQPEPPPEWPYRWWYEPTGAPTEAPHGRGGSPRHA